jgi:hypothetical protein
VWHLPRITSGITTLSIITVTILIVRVVVEINVLALSRLSIVPEVWQVLARLEKDLDQVVEHRLILVIDECGGETLIADTSSTT